jgi:hypothetical protein
MNPILGYVCSAMTATAFYAIWLFTIAYTASPDDPTKLQSAIVFAIFICVFGGFLPALGLLIAPWLVAVRLYRRVNIPGSIFYPVIGATSLAALACITASLAPKLLFVEDQTFLEGVMIAAERQGPCFLLAGAVFGLTYWLCRRRTAAVGIASEHPGGR